MLSKRVAIIGAGASGLAAIKSTLEAGLIPVCFERTDDLGGIWRYTDEVLEGKGAVARSTVMKSSKEMSAFSDCPPPDGFPTFLHHEYVYKYLRQYAKTFDLEKYIRYNIGVERLAKACDFSSSGKWSLTTKDRLSGNVEHYQFDLVMVCTGHFCIKHYADFPGNSLQCGISSYDYYVESKYTPDLPGFFVLLSAHVKTAVYQGLEDFRGEILHSHDYRDGSAFVKKKVVVVGVGNSGCDVASDLANICPPVYLSTRRGTWIYKQVSKGGIPFDMLKQTRWKHSLENNLPMWLRHLLLGNNINSEIDYEKSGLKPQNLASFQALSLSDDLPYSISSGKVVIKPNIKRMTKEGVEFEDGSILDKVDAVIMATGYKFGFPFIDKDITDVKDNRFEYYMYQWLPDIEKHTISFIGCVQPIGSVFPIVELQCRWALQIFMGEKTLPPSDVMWRDIATRSEALRRKFVDTQRHRIIVDFIAFGDELADKIGCSVNIPKYLLRDPALAYKLFFGPCTPYAYRLEGPHSWPGASKAIETQWERIMHSKTKRRTGEKLFSFCYVHLLVVIYLCVAVVYLAT